MICAFGTSDFVTAFLGRVFQCAPLEQLLVSRNHTTALRYAKLFWINIVVEWESTQLGDAQPFESCLLIEIFRIHAPHLGTLLSVMYSPPKKTCLTNFDGQTASVVSIYGSSEPSMRTLFAHVYNSSVITPMNYVMQNTPSGSCDLGYTMEEKKSENIWPMGSWANSLVEIYSKTMYVLHTS